MSWSELLSPPSELSFLGESVADFTIKLLAECPRLTRGNVHVLLHLGPLNSNDMKKYMNSAVAFPINLPETIKPKCLNYSALWRCLYSQPYAYTSVLKERKNSTLYIFFCTYIKTRICHWVMNFGVSVSIFLHPPCYLALKGSTLCRLEPSHHKADQKTNHHHHEVVTFHQASPCTTE